LYISKAIFPVYKERAVKRLLLL